MTSNSNNGRSRWTDERLNELAVIVESNAKAIGALSSRIDSNAKAIDALSSRIDSNAKAIEALTNENRASINALAEASGRTLRAVELLREAQEEDRTNLHEYRERTDSLTAAVERLDTILDYLIKRDAEGGSR